MVSDENRSNTEEAVGIRGILLISSCRKGIYCCGNDTKNWVDRSKLMLIEVKGLGF
jgi:hypothetical protein